MKRNSLLMIGLILSLGLIGVVAYVLRPPAEATAPIEAIPLATTVPIQNTSQVVPTKDSSSEVGADSTPTKNVPNTTSAVVLLAIEQARSNVQFSINEDLRGTPTTAIGSTNQVAGEINVNLATPSNSQIGPILINARTLATDNNFRNRAIQNEILDTGRYEFITFTPTSITGLPTEALDFGETISFQITGELTIRDITQSITFEASVTLVSANQLEGSATATVLRSNYNLLIPNVPSVANVSDEIRLEIGFVATPIQQ